MLCLLTEKYWILVLGAGKQVTLSQERSLLLPTENSLARCRYGCYTAIMIFSLIMLLASDVSAQTSKWMEDCGKWVPELPQIF